MIGSSSCHRLLQTARRLLRQRGPNVTLREVAIQAGIGGGADIGALVVELVLEQRLGHVLELLHGLDDGSLPDPGGRLWSSAVREIVATRIDRPGFSLQLVARMLAVSPRTLQRRLAEEGTSWRAEIDATRSERAKQLARLGYTHEMVAARLGYSGGRALRRALQRWDRDDRAGEVGVAGHEVGTFGPLRPCGGLA